MVRQKAQEFIQHILEEEVAELLGREKSERREVVDAGGLSERLRQAATASDELRDDHAQRPSGERTGGAARFRAPGFGNRRTPSVFPSRRPRRGLAPFLH